jgi:hypothetical protein
MLRQHSLVVITETKTEYITDKPAVDMWIIFKVHLRRKPFVLNGFIGVELWALTGAAIIRHRRNPFSCVSRPYSRETSSDVYNTCQRLIHESAKDTNLHQWLSSNRLKDYTHLIISCVYSYTYPYMNDSIVTIVDSDPIPQKIVTLFIMLWHSIMC